MHNVYFDVHRQTDSRTLLRQMDATRRIQKERELNPAEIAPFIAQVKTDYANAFNLLDTPKLKALGQRLYAWLDGPSQRWLAELHNAHRDGWALHIDVEAKEAEGLRHLPWELMHTGGQWLCGDAHQSFTPVRHVCDTVHPTPTQNRPLRVLFMACSPRDVTPVLDYENEEIAILAAASKHDIELVVEETGSLAGLTERLSDYEAGYFDVLHLTGHADLINNKPVFLMEDDFGQRFEASPDHILRACRRRLPRLMFLSGCSTGRAPDQASASATATASMCEAMVQHGVSAALGWALPVYDHTASAAAALLYEQLATGTRLDEAVARTRHMLLEDHPDMWHLLRLYADARPLTALVTAPKTRGRAVLPPTPDTATQLRDLGGKLEVCERKHFVGRRREVQASLRCLKAKIGDGGPYAEGVLLQGMGGMGKSSLVARLCDRLPDAQRLIWVGRVDWPAFVRGLSEAPDLSEALAAVELEQRKTALKVRLRQLLRQPSLIAKPALFIFDDFEQNLSGHHPSQPQYQIGKDGHYAVEADTLEIVAALMAAIRDEASRSRVIVTSRYQPALPPPARLHLVPLIAMPQADLNKKAEQLAQLKLARRHPDRRDLYARALMLSAGNPRLLTHLDTAFKRDDDGTLDLSALLQRLEATAADFREALLLRSLLDTLNDETRHALAGLALFETPVPNAALAALLACPARASQAMLGSAVASGLAEQHEGDSAANGPRYFVNPLVAALLPPYPAQSADYARAAAWLHKAWWEDKTDSGTGLKLDEALEVQRLALHGQMCDVAVELGRRLSNTLIRQYRYSEAAALCQRSLPVCPHHQLYMQLGRAQRELGEVNAAEQSYQQSLQAYQERAALAAAQKDYADIADNYAGLLHARGDYEAALPYFEQSLAIRQQIGDKSGEGTILNNMATTAHARGDYD
nr:CHAT domain-containing protein [Anaerolineae bacterium]